MRPPIFVIICLIQAPMIFSHHDERIIFPLTYIDHSVELHSLTKELPLQTGKCQDYRNRDLELKLPGVSPRNLYPGFINSYRISCLSLTDSSIERIQSGSFAYVSNLLYLDLSRNRIQLCDLLNFGNLERLRTLVIDENDSQGQETNLILSGSSYFSRLEHLYLRKNFLRDISVNLRQHFPSMTHLYLSDNRLEGGVFAYLQLPHTLTHLHLERNWIREMDTHELINLSSLFLDGNRIGSICSWRCHTRNHLVLRGMAGLKFLSLLRNEISYVDSGTFDETRSLQSLNLAHNSISHLPPGIFDVLQRLEDLSLSYNRLSQVPDISRLSMIGSLSLDHNNIDRISSHAFAHLHCLKWLSLGGNRISSVETNAFVDLPLLEELDLSDNQLSYLPWEWITSSCLQHLDVRNNHFASFESLSLRNLWSLTHLYVQGTPLSNIITTTHWQIGYNTTVHVKYSSSVNRVPCYVSCDGGYTIPRITFRDEWTWYERVILMMKSVDFLHQRQGSMFLLIAVNKLLNAGHRTHQSSFQFLYPQFTQLHRRTNIGYKPTMIIVKLLIHVGLSFTLMSSLSASNSSCEDGHLHINLAGTGLQRLKDRFLSSSLINSLHLEDNQIWSIAEGAFADLPNLQYLNLARNLLPYTKLTQTFPKLKTLILDAAITGLSQKDVQQSFTNDYSPCPLELPLSDAGLHLELSANLPELEQLHLRNNGIISIAGLQNSPNLTHLYLGTNRISRELIEAFKHPTLKHLHLENNSIESFNSPVMHQLKVLVLDHNNIYRLCSGDCSPKHVASKYEPMVNLSGAGRLQSLSVANNVLMDIDEDAFVSLKSLHFLNLSGNFLETIGSGLFTNLTKLKSLALSDNGLTEIPDVNDLKKLEVLLLNGNHVKVISKTSFTNLPKLKTLSFANNDLSQIDAGSFDALTSLNELDLSGNKLLTLPENWISGILPQRLHLNNNLFTEIENMSLNNESCTEYLSIAGNPMVKLATKELLKLSRTLVINIDIGRETSSDRRKD
ncbi:chaoptin-like [Diachasmimorpha longicaudata]|uniref:chaoptin-like n=1 Tax=Diachasmimorpha longicaudata TaxID=58733 RepID=UPI0030B8A5D8